MFTIVNSTSERLDLAERKEMKYVVGADIDKLRSVTSNRCVAVNHNENKYSSVNSVYFDNVRLDAGFANLDGLGHRTKLRIRWYDTAKPSKDFFVEIKWKKNRISGKHRFQVRSTRSLGDLTYDQIVQGLEESMPVEFVPAIIANPEPIVLVRYRREHFVSFDKKLRLTLDYGIRFCDQVGKEAISARFPAYLQDFALIEGKIPVGYERELRALLHPFQLRVSRCSKYLHGCRLISRISPVALA